VGLAFWGQNPSFFLIAFASAGCRIHSQAPYWIETHGEAVGLRIAGWSTGALLLGPNQQLWIYPGGWSNPWPPQAHTHDLRAVAAANTTGYAIATDGRVLRFSDNRWFPYEGSAAWNASEIAATEDDKLLVLSDGKLRLFEHGQLLELGCDGVNGSAVAAAGPGQAYVLDQQGALFLSADERCDGIAAPTPLRRIAGRSDRLLGVGVDGSVWRRRGSTWTRLAAPHKYRPGQVARETRVQDVGVSAYSTWIIDSEGSVFLLSDEA